ncbi:MAG TPA: Mov34/MPN/PAD-1 family protein [Thermoanaerobaculia bacterium]|nr:Mov34/MPN/PAD-1 family protein [Thermoanaerobaculia bacterium]
MQTAMLLVLLVTNADRALETDRNRMMVLAWDLLAGARYGLDPKEHAAFIVADERGQLQLSRWPWGAESMRATYRGEVPRTAVAIVHTHPNELPNPSRGDIALARNLGMRVYVITRTSVICTDGSRTTKVAYGDWNPHR